MTEYALFYQNIVPENVEKQTEEIFLCYLRSKRFLSKYQYWKTKSTSEITMNNMNDT